MDPLAAHGVGCRRMESVTQMQIPLGHMLPNGIGRGKAAIGNDPVYILRQIHTGSHQHRGSTHRNTRQIDRQTAPGLFVHPLDPGKAIIPLQHAKSHVLAAAFALPLLLCK